MIYKINIRLDISALIALIYSVISDPNETVQIGSIRQIIGPVVDVFFQTDPFPNIYVANTIFRYFFNEKWSKIDQNFYEIFEKKI